MPNFITREKKAMTRKQLIPLKYTCGDVHCTRTRCVPCALLLISTRRSTAIALLFLLLLLLLLLQLHLQLQLRHSVESSGVYYSCNSSAIMTRVVLHLELFSASCVVFGVKLCI